MMLLLLQPKIHHDFLNLELLDGGLNYTQIAQTAYTILGHSLALLKLRIQYRDTSKTYRMKVPKTSPFRSSYVSQCSLPVYPYNLLKWL
jgi:hypothetical protein